ncbi:MAG TPA: DUF169 domain-containing protein [Dehalococcoidia bacterium]|nr:DUF169 domain-containing protein [Dehalococcoidia bacterium]
MGTEQLDLSILDKFNFETQPVGVKFLFTKPDGIGRLDKILDFCEMLVEAQKSSPFYVTKENFTCIGPLILGMTEHDPIFEAGQVGPKLEVFKEARANRRLYHAIPRLGKDTVNYVAFSPLDQLTFEPDVLIITASTSQAEILLRAMSYTSGKLWCSKGTPVIGCAWLYIYPYTSGELNFTVTGFGFGMKSRRLFPEGLILMSIPWDLLPSMVENLQDMNWVPHSYTIGGEEHKKKVRRIVDELKQELAAE